jgi:hypothetical protein
MQWFAEAKLQTMWNYQCQYQNEEILKHGGQVTGNDMPIVLSYHADYYNHSKVIRVGHCV